MNNLVSDVAFKWFLTLMTLGITATWLVYDALKLWWLRRADRRDPNVRDKHFGYAIGVVVCTIGVVGVLRFNGVL